MSARPQPSPSPPQDYKDYFDIMLMGKTGMGKTTTAEKIIIANPVSLPGRKHDLEPTVNTKPSSTHCTDVSMWYLSDEPDEMERVSQRLKDLILWRSLESPHEEINRRRKEDSRDTDKCELLCNDTSKVRVLDVPGFHGTNESYSFSKYDNDLSLVRKILHIKNAHKFKFNRIVYFLPETGILIRDSQILHMEISLMWKYFGRSIFDSMVVAATHNHNTYRNFAKTLDIYSEEDLKTTRHCFEKVLWTVLESKDSLSVPLTFLSLFDTCERVLQKIKDSQVSKEGVGLEFNPSTCARCSKDLRNDHKGGEGDSSRPRNCHPMMIPKHTKFKQISAGTVHLVTFSIFMNKWPSFGYLDEKCLRCGEPPSAEGCTPLGSNYAHLNSREKIPVSHTSEVEENYEIDIDPSSENVLKGNDKEEESTDAAADLPRVSKRNTSNTQLAEVYLRKCKEQEITP